MSARMRHVKAGAAVVTAVIFSCPIAVALPTDSIPSAGDAGHPLAVLFVGNSLTYVNDLPHLVQRFAAAGPLHAALTVWSVSSGGAQLSEQWKKGDAVRMLRQHRPDVLVLQGQSTEPLTAQSDFYRYGQLLKEEADRVGARTVLFETWARPQGDAFYAWSESGGSPAAMQRRLDDAYEWLARQLDAGLAPVGEAFEVARTRLPSVHLLDGTQHPTVAGSYLAAAVICRSLFPGSPPATGFTAGLPESDAAALRRVALAVR